MPSNSLEQEAMDRVRRMYSSFDNRSAHNQTAPKPCSDPKPPFEKSAPKPPSKEADREQSGGSVDKPKSILDVFLKNQDQSLILLLLVMLMKDGADMNLMLALVYLLI